MRNLSSDDLIVHEPPAGLLEAAMAEATVVHHRRSPAIFLAAAIFAGVLIGRWSVVDGVEQVAPDIVVAAHTDDLVTVQFLLSAPDATSVAVAGTFNDWDVSATPLQVRPDGRYLATLQLAPGRHEYLFVVDGAWVLDPAAILTHDDGFGSRNAVLEI